MKQLSKQFVVLFMLVLLGSLVIAGLAYRTLGDQSTLAASAITTPMQRQPVSTSTATIPAPLPPVQNSGSILGIDGNIHINYPNIPWVRLGYPSCGGGNLTGHNLQRAIQHYHSQGIRVLLLICQWTGGPGLLNTQRLNDAAQGGADAVGCGNEQMKPGHDTLYVPPTLFAKFFDNCQQTIHAVHPETTVILGSLDPHVGGVDYQPLLDQVNYLNQMQEAMNTQVHPGGHWDWHTQILGLIDSWHNGYPNLYVNSLNGLFHFWAQQFHVDLNSGALGKHIWVTEGTGCFKGCGIDVSSAYQVAVSHIFTLITDVQTTMRYSVPFFYFSGMDFNLEGIRWPIGVLDTNGRSKPLRQDLPMGARTLLLNCAGRNVVVADQEQLLARFYSGCSVPDNYISILIR